MRSFKIPFEEKIEDKIIGGILTIKQFLIILIIPIIAIGLSFLIKLPLLISVIFVLISLIIAFLFAFVKINEDTLTKYLFRIIKFTKKEKLIKYRRFE